jgi:hypothetical protein
MSAQHEDGSSCGQMSMTIGEPDGSGPLPGSWPDAPAATGGDDHVAWHRTALRGGVLAHGAAHALGRQRLLVDVQHAVDIRCRTQQRGRHTHRAGRRGLRAANARDLELVLRAAPSFELRVVDDDLDAVLA